MGIWDSYQSRLDVRGANVREVKANRKRQHLSQRIAKSLSYHPAIVDGAQQELAIINSDALNQKTVCTMPGDSILCGAMVEWQGNHWLVTAVDANNELYTKGTMLQCNYLLKWITEDGEIVERWCIVSDSTKYLTGETVSRYNENGLVLGDTRISVTIARDEYTAKLGRRNRFLIDDPGSDMVLAYQLSKPFKVGSVYNGHGVLDFILTEVNSEDTDNTELLIADYYKYFPRMGEPEEVKPGTQETVDGKRVWL